MNSLSRSQGTFTLWLFAVTAGVMSVATLIAQGLISYGDSPYSSGQIGLPSVFWITTGLLVVGSAFLQRAQGFVQREKQQPFRRSMVWALAAGTLFVGVQSYGVWRLIGFQTPSEVQTSASAFILVFVALHGLHFTVAMMFLVYVTLKSHADRYDHEYYWGVTVCAWFWHVLGLAWVAILGVIIIARIDQYALQA